MAPLLNYGIDLLILAFVLYRQVRVRPLAGARLPVVLIAIGVLALSGYSRGHPVPGAAWAFIAGSLAAGVVLGALRALTVRLWRADGRLVRQGSWLTVLLWLLSVGGHLAAGALLRDGVAAAAGASALLFIGVTLGAQYLVLTIRARLAPALTETGAG